MTRVEFVLQDFGSRGTRSPCVARTVPQTGRLVDAYLLPADVRQQIVDVSFNVMRRLGACEDILERVGQQVRAGMERIENDGLRVQAGGRVVDLPSVVNLQDEAELFLYTAKLALRDIAGLFRPLYGQVFDHKYHKIRDWSLKTHGENAELTRLLRDDADWVEQLINMRNVVEHPTDSHGPLIIRNFSLVGGGDPLRILQPVWYLRDQEPGAIADDMRVFADNMLTFYEDILAAGLAQLQPDAPFVIVEIPEGERNPECPMRLQLALAHRLPEA